MTKSTSLCIGVILAGIASCIGACNVLGPAAVLVNGPPSIDAKYKLPEARPMIIFIDDRLPRLGRKQLRNLIAESAQKTLLAKSVVTNVIDYRAAVAVADRETAGQPMDIVTIAKTVQAEIIVFATVDAFYLSPDGQTMLPAARLRVKVLDANLEAPRIWPDDAEGFPLTVQLNQRATPLPRSPSDIMKAENAFAAQVGEGLAKLFFEHEIKESVGPSKK